MDFGGMIIGTCEFCFCFLIRIYGETHTDTKTGMCIHARIMQVWVSMHVFPSSSHRGGASGRQGTHGAVQSCFLSQQGLQLLPSQFGPGLLSSFASSLWVLAELVF